MYLAPDARGLAGAQLLGIERGEFLALLAAEGPCGTALLGNLLAQLIAGKTIVDIGPPRAVVDRPPHGLAELAVIDDVDAALDLLSYDFGHGCARPSRERRAVVGLAFVARHEHFH